MKCYKCGSSIETGRSFRPVDPPGTKGRRWICNVCQGTKQETVESVLFGEEQKEEPKFRRPTFRDKVEGCRSFLKEILVGAVAGDVNRMRFGHIMFWSTLRGEFEVRDEE